MEVQAKVRFQRIFPGGHTKKDRGHDLMIKGLLFKTISYVGIFTETVGRDTDLKHIDSCCYSYATVGLHLFLYDIIGTLQANVH